MYGQREILLVNNFYLISVFNNWPFESKILMPSDSTHIVIVALCLDGQFSLQSFQYLLKLALM